MADHEEEMEVDEEDQEVLTEEIDFSGIPGENIDKMKKGKDITREVVKKLLEKDRRIHDGRDTDQLILIIANFNHEDNKGNSSAEKILFDEFKLYKIASDKNDYTNIRGGYLAHITGTRTEQCRKIKKLHGKIKRRLENDRKLDISKAHIVASLVLYYGEDAPQAQSDQADPNN